MSSSCHDLGLYLRDCRGLWAVAGDVAELADALDLGSSSLGSAGSTPVVPILSGSPAGIAFEEPLGASSIEPVAQLVEQRTFNPLVVGSSPARLIEDSPGRKAWRGGRRKPPEQILFS